MRVRTRWVPTWCSTSRSTSTCCAKPSSGYSGHDPAGRANLDSRPCAAAALRRPGDRAHRPADALHDADHRRGRARVRPRDHGPARAALAGLPAGAGEAAAAGRSAHGARDTRGRAPPGAEDAGSPSGVVRAFDAQRHWYTRVPSATLRAAHAARGGVNRMAQEFVTLVSGLPRSGTSMMMKMLEA